MPETPPCGAAPDDNAKVEDRPPVSIKPVKKKIGEPPGNLRRREAWYKKRTGGRPERSAT